MSSGTIAPNGSVPLPALAIDGQRRFKRKPGPATNRSAALPYIDDSGNQINFKCPKCGVTVGTEDHATDCDWTLSDEERAAIRSRDPEMIPARCYIEKTRRWLPQFDHNQKPMSGKERRERRQRTKCSY